MLVQCSNLLQLNLLSLSLNETIFKTNSSNSSMSNWSIIKKKKHFKVNLKSRHLEYIIYSYCRYAFTNSSLIFRWQHKDFDSYQVVKIPGPGIFHLLIHLSVNILPRPQIRVAIGTQSQVPDTKDFIFLIKCYRSPQTRAQQSKVPTEAINSIATAISTLPDTAVTSEYATAKVGPLLAK